MKILSIDDSRAVHAFLETSLKATAFKLTHAMSGQDGIDLLKSDPTQFVLILLDWEMPKMNGPDVLRKIRSEGIQTPVIMLTSKNSVDDIRIMIEAGAAEYVMKPFTPEILIEKISTLVGSGSS